MRAEDALMAAARLRQWPTIAWLTAYASARPEIFAAAVLVGSFAAGLADALSDIDLILLAPDGGFARAWDLRHELHAEEPIMAWDEPRPGLPEVAGHSWLTREIIMVETLFATASSGFRLAEPHVVLAGTLPAQTEMRHPISRGEFTSTPHPVDHAYSALKAAVRRFTEGSRQGAKNSSSAM